MPQLITVYWRDIPAQVITKQRRLTEKIQLSERFAQAIDAAAMRAGLAGSDAYLEQWRRATANCGDDLRAEVEAAAARVEKSYDQGRLKALIRNFGNESE